MYNSEKDMYPEVILWLDNYLKDLYGKLAKKITVSDTHDSDLCNFVIKLSYQKFFPEYTTFQIRQDITGFIEYQNKVDLVFIECKNTLLNLSHLSQLIGYSCIALPILSILISPQGMGDTLNKLLRTYNRKDVLNFHPSLKFSICKWDTIKKDIDYSNSIF